MGRVVIDGEKCKGCELCAASCPKGLLIIGETFNSKGVSTARFSDPAKCIGCAICAKTCPDYAIVEVYR